jgi:KaiC/GvpD/RAD55 family RecA-like ATPase
MDPDAPSLDPEALDPGTNVLVAGPVMTRKRRLMLRLLAAARPAERGTVVATTRTSADRIVREFRTLTGEVPDDRLSVVDCTGVQALSSRAGSAPNRRHVGDPGDLTGIGMGLTEFMRRYYHDVGAARVGIHSLSTILMYTDFRRLFRFLHVVTGRVDSSGFVGVYAVDDAALEARDRDVLLQLFDTVVETREGAAGRELRVRGAGAGTFGPTAWTLE